MLKRAICYFHGFDTKANSSYIVTIQVIVNGAPLSAAIIPSKTSNPFFLIVEM